MPHKPFAEIVESSLQSFVAQSWQWDKFPSFGSLVTVTNGSRITIGIVHQIQTGSMDPTRYPFPYQKTEEELRREQPQIFEFLRTTFTCLVAGYFEKGSTHYVLCPTPPKIHAFVSPISPEYMQRYSNSPHYLHLLFGLAHNVFNLDELLLALLTNMQQEELLTDEKLAEFITTFSLLTGNDYRRLKLFLQRVESIKLATGSHVRISQNTTSQSV
jgi:hypothetical protein